MNVTELGMAYGRKKAGELEEVDDDIVCECGTVPVDIPGLGACCPNRDCEIFDGPFLEE